MVRLIRIVCLAAATASAVAVGLPAATTQPTTAPTSFTLNFKDVSLDTVLTFFSQNIGFEILKDGAIDARVTLMSRQPVSPEEAITMLSAALKANGFTVTRQGRLLHIASRDKAKKENIPVHFGADPASVADTDELITQVVPIANVTATKLRDDLKPLIAPDADVTANDGSNTIILTDSSSNIRRIVQIISMLDQHESSTSVIRVIQLKHANATATAKLIETLFKPAAPEQGQNPRMMQMQPQPPQPGGPPTGSQRHGTTVVTAADDRTNTLLVMASADTLKIIDGIVAQLDTGFSNPAPTTEMRVYLLKFADAEATAKIVNTIFKPQKSGPDLGILFIDIGESDQSKKEAGVNAVADDRTNSVVVTAPVERLKDVDTLINRLDASPMAGAEMRIIHLHNADAAAVAQLIQDMFIPKKEEQNQRPLLYYLLNQESNEQKDHGAKIIINADERTNILFVDAPREWLDLIEKIVREVDSENTSEDTTFVYRLRNSQATHLEYTLNVLFGNISAPNPNSQNQQQNPLLQNQPNGQNQLVNLPQQSNTTNNPSSRRNNQTSQQASRLPSAGAQAASELAGRVLVVAEPDTNSLLVSTATKYQAEVKSLIAELDRPVQQVLIKVLIAEVTHDNSADFGTDFSVLNLRPGGAGQKLGSTLGAAAGAASATAPPGMVVSILESNLTATLQALAQENKLDVLSRPYILTSDNQQADITVGSEVPFVTGTNVDSTGGIHNSAQYQNIGIILTVTPHVNPEGLVTLEVNPQISALTAQTVTIQNGVSLPVFEVRSADTYLTVRDGQTAVIGGLMQDQKTVGISKIPILGDIPLIGKLLFSYTTDAKTKTELLIFLTPHVAPEPDHLKEMGEDEIKGLKLTPNAVAPGVFEEHLRGLQRGAIPQTQPAVQEPPVKSFRSGNSVQ